nr:TonB-dependent receptor [uncultured Bacteroides sp.]
MKQVNLKLVKTILPILMGLFLSMGVFAQQITVTGVVKDAKGEPIIGANVAVKGTTTGTITDLDGVFHLQAPQNSVITVSFIGYKTVEVKALKNLTVVLQEDAVMLEGTVVIGYGTVKKNDLTGSVTAIKPDKLNRGLTTTATDMITGKIAGVNVTSDGGAPGSDVTIRVRGGSSLSASNKPLIVIDGLPIDNEGIKGVSNMFSTINPNDIETFTVLKDASATAIYGSRASNGVIIITTKKGEKGSAPRVSYDGNISVSTKVNSIDVMSADEFRDFVTNKFGANSGAVKLLGTANTDWQKEIFRTAIGHDHNVTVSGGLKNMPYRVSVGYTNQNGILDTSNFERYTGSFNLSPSFFDNHLNVNINAKGMISNNRFADTGAIGAALDFDPTKPVMDGNSKYGGYFAWEESGNFITIATKNPVSMLKQKKETANSKNIIANAQFDYKFPFLPELHANLNLGMDVATGTQDVFYPKESPIGYVENGKTGSETIDKYNHLLDFYLQYAKDLNDLHHIDLMGGYSWQHFHRNTENAYNNLDSNNPTSYIFKTENYLVSFFGRLNYSFMNKYLVTATLRDDGTSRFSKDNRWGLFPSVALGWKIKEESFLKDVDAVSDLKLRLGYGITGQQDLSMGDYSYMATYYAGQDGAYYQLGDQFAKISRPDGYNPNLKWEETTTWNAGLDFGFANNRITAALDYYYRKTKDLINLIEVPAGTNFKNRVTSNIGSLKNQGVEFAINAKAISTPDLVWDLGFNAAWNNNKITKLTTQDNASTIVAIGDIEGGTGNKVQAHGIGHSANSFYVFEQVYDQAGKPIEGLFVDRNKDGVINEEDRYFYKKPSADVIMGFTSKLVYKSWDFSFSLRSNLGNYAYNNIASSKAAISEGNINNKGYLSNRPSSAFKSNFQNVSLYSDYYVTNASFLRCDNITLGHTFKNLFGKVSGRVYGTVQNAFVITKYDGLDPEVKDGLDKNIYPRPLVGILGVSLNF